jgi:hypothetical protein
MDGFWLLAVLAHSPPPRVTEERYLRMTDQPQNPQEYWYIPLPKNKFPKPKP